MTPDDFKHGMYYSASNGNVPHWTIWKCNHGSLILVLNRAQSPFAYELGTTFNIVDLDHSNFEETWTEITEEILIEQQNELKAELL